MEETKQHPEEKSLLHIAVKLLVILSGISLLGFLIQLMPVFSDLKIPGLPVSLLRVTHSILLFIGVVFVLNFSYDLETLLPRVLPRFEEIGKLSKQLIFVLAALHAYINFQALFLPFLAEFRWIYQLTFLLLFLSLLVKIGITFYRSSDKLGPLILTGIRNLTDMFK